MKPIRIESDNSGVVLHCGETTYLAVPAGYCEWHLIEAPRGAPEGCSLVLGRWFSDNARAKALAALAKIEAALSGEAAAPNDVETPEREHLIADLRMGNATLRQENKRLRGWVEYARSILNILNSDAARLVDAALHTNEEAPDA